MVGAPKPMRWLVRASVLIAVTRSVHASSVASSLHPADASAARAAKQAHNGQSPLILAPPADSFPPYEPQPFFRFELVHESSKSRARVGRIHTPHGIIDTPGFVPVGTNAALKGMTNSQSADAGVQLMFCNTYHLIVHPGPDVVAEAGGLHAYMGRTRPIITDSGGFQVFSLAASEAADSPELKRRSATRGRNEGTLLSVSERGVRFRSYFDSTTIKLTPESSVQAQKKLGADIIIPLDELPPNGVSRERLLESVGLSHRWMARSLREHLADRRQQAMYAVVHGGTDREMRSASVDYLSSLPFDGMAVGGSLGRDRAEMMDLLQYLMPLLPREKPNHLLGIADPGSVLAAAPLGVDTFDSCFPTRVARHGTLFTRQGTLDIAQSKHRNDFGPIDPTMPTLECSRAYMHHLCKMREPLYATLASMHNIQFMTELMTDIRTRILADDL